MYLWWDLQRKQSEAPAHQIESDVKLKLLYNGGGLAGSGSAESNTADCWQCIQLWFISSILSINIFLIGLCNLYHWDKWQKKVYNPFWSRVFSEGLYGVVHKKICQDPLITDITNYSFTWWDTSNTIWIMIQYKLSQYWNLNLRQVFELNRLWSNVHESTWISYSLNI